MAAHLLILQGMSSFFKIFCLSWYLHDFPCGDNFLNSLHSLSSILGVLGTWSWQNA